MRLRVRFTTLGKSGNGLVRWMMVLFREKQDGAGKSSLSLRMCSEYLNRTNNHNATTIFKFLTFVTSRYG